LAERFGGRRQILAFLAILGSVCAIAGAQIGVDAAGLSEGESVYGLIVPGDPIPYVNLEAITLSGWGAIEPHSYTDVSFYAYGLFTDVNLVNSGPISVTATGGTVDINDLDLPVNASNRAYGIYSSLGLIDTSGQIHVTATGGTAVSGAVGGIPYDDSAASGQAYGIFTEDGAIDNSADVNATAVGGTVTGTVADAYYEIFAVGRAYGLYLEDNISPTYPDRHISNSGDLSVTATGGDAQGSVDEANASAWASGIESHDAPVVNSGSILAAATGGTALSTYSLAEDEPGAYANATTYGIKVEVGVFNNSDVGDLSNNGAVTTSGIGGTATGQGGAEASARAEVYGVYVEGTGSVWADPMSEGETQVENHAAITAVATGGTAESVSAHATADAQALGLVTYYADVNNTGNILATAEGGVGVSGEDIAVYASAIGMYASSGNVTNSGDIAVAATGGTGTAGDGAQATFGASAIGLAVSGTNTTNTGDITVTAHGEPVTGGSTVYGDVYANGISVTASTLNNSGAVIATATAESGFDSYAYGISSGGYNTLTNTGIVRAIADTPFEVYVTANTTTLDGIYNVTLDGDPNQASLGVATGATLALNDATLTVTALDGETLWDTEYKLFEAEGTGVVDGNFAEVQAVNPNTTATYYDQGTAGSVDDTVSLAYTPGGSPTLASAAVEKQAISLATDVVNHHMTASLLQNLLSPSSSGLLADAGSTAESLALAEAASDKSAGVFAEPYYSIVDKDANPLGYDARLWGFSLGYERFLGGTLVGLHAGYGQADIDYTGAGYRGNSEDQDIVTAGFTGLTRWDPWLLRYGLTGFHGSHDYQGLTGLALDEQETADYDSYGAGATLMGGRIFRRGSHILLPEAGLNWLWAHRQRYTTEATDPAWDTTYSAMNDHDLYAAAALRWLGTFVRDEVRISPSVAIGVRHLLTDAETNAWQSIPGTAPALVRSEQDRTAMTLSSSLTLTGDEHALSLAYDGEYSPDAQRHNLWLRYSWLF
jgi:hypothetical protein